MPTAQRGWGFVVAGLIALLTLPAHAQKLSQLPFASVPFSGSELFYMTQDGRGKKTTSASVFAAAGNMVPTNAALAATPTTGLPNGIWRGGINVLGDNAPAFYVPLSGTCAANGLTVGVFTCTNTNTGGNAWRADIDPSTLDGGQFVIDPNSTDVVTGFATMTFTPILGNSMTPGKTHFDAMFGVLFNENLSTSNSSNNFFALFNTKLGSEGRPILAGTQGNMTAYGCNHTNAQNLEDTNHVDGAQCLSVTYNSTGTGPSVVIASDFEILGPSAEAFLWNALITTNSSTIGANVGGWNLAQTGPVGLGFGWRIATGTVLNALETSGATIINNVINDRNAVLSSDGVLGLGTSAPLRSGHGSMNSHLTADQNVNIFVNGATGNVALEAINEALSINLVMELRAQLAFPVSVTAPISGVPAGALCVDDTRVLYIKTTPGACL